jgi:electron transfer flavoprotein alpha subunit
VLAVVFVRDGILPAGANETIAECSGRVLLCGTGTALGAAAITTSAPDVRAVDTGPFAPGALASALAPLIDDAVVVLPASADGRDLAPRLAHVLGRPLLAGAIEVGPHGATVARRRGLSLEDHAGGGPFVATLVPGVRGAEPGAASNPTSISATVADIATSGDVEVLGTIAPDPASIDLAEAPRIIAGGAGLDSPERFDELAEVAAALGASLGATRVITDRGWLDHARQIGTTGVVVDPRLYVAFGISGAVQHTAGLGTPEHVIAVNTDPYCPMMQMADLAVVSDANAVLDPLLSGLRASGKATADA